MPFHDDEWNDWYSNMDAPERNEKDPKRLTELDIDRRPAPSGIICTADAWQMVVRGWGVLVVSVDGVRILDRTELASGTVESFGPAWK